MKNKTTLLFGGVIIVVIALLVWARASSEPQERALGFTWPGTEVACLISGHQNLAQHIHPTLAVTVDGEVELVPANVGVNNECMSEVHTHDASGGLHIESVSHGKTFGLGDYFAVRGQALEREGYGNEVFVNGQVVDPGTYEFADADSVEIQYTSN